MRLLGGHVGIGGRASQSGAWLDHVNPITDRLRFGDALNVPLMLLKGAVLVTLSDVGLGAAQFVKEHHVFGVDSVVLMLAVQIVQRVALLTDVESLFRCLFWR